MGASRLPRQVWACFILVCQAKCTLHCTWVIAINRGWASEQLLPCLLEIVYLCAIYSNLTSREDNLRGVAVWLYKVSSIKFCYFWNCDGRLWYAEFDTPTQASRRYIPALMRGDRARNIYWRSWGPMLSHNNKCLLIIIFKLLLRRSKTIEDDQLLRLNFCMELSFSLE